MTIVACPKCADSVVLPGRASPRATVRCPLCQEEFSLAEVLDKMPPALIVVDDPDAAAAGTAAATAAAPLFAEPESNGGGFAPLSIETAASAAPPTTAARRRRPAAAAKRKPKSPVAEGVKIVVSGASLPLRLPELVEGLGVNMVPIISSGRAADIPGAHQRRFAGRA